MELLYLDLHCLLIFICTLKNHSLLFTSDILMAVPMVEQLRALFLNHLTAVSGVDSSPAVATCETSQVLLAGVPGVFSRGSPIFAPPTDWPGSYELK